jgi:hypothetical protein
MHGQNLNIIIIIIHALNLMYNEDKRFEVEI